MLVTFLSLLCPSGVNATQIISREAGLDTQKLDFIFCSYFILENFFFSESEHNWFTCLFRVQDVSILIFSSLFFFFLL